MTNWYEEKCFSTRTVCGKILQIKNHREYKYNQNHDIEINVSKIWSPFFILIEKIIHYTKLNKVIEKND